ncbi:hypothetical protein AYO49_03620 [Verrucomicrobiaceae bacterium SCGC AG-212-N21]|nr:hypothetical protein AYO49_03620 [Verrucomicrobiaceae bacterium SCGC AG-212-N21]
MSDEQSKASGDADKELEVELELQIRAGRTFSLSEAIGRMGGPGVMKGASAVPPKLQAEAEVEGYIRKHLSDAGGVLLGVLVRSVKESDLLLRSFDHPIASLESYLRRVLDSDDLLRELVRETDAEWGRMLDERPFFEQPGRSPHPDDPYTLESVRVSLQKLLETKHAGGESNG